MRYSEEYYIRLQGEQKGPYTFSELKRLYDKKLISPETSYWRDGMEHWEVLSELCGAPVETRWRKVRQRQMLAFLVLIILAGVGVSLTPVFITGWREVNQHEFTPQGAYWRARGYAREEATKRHETISFERFEKSSVELANGVDASVHLPGMLFRANGNSARGAWRVLMQFHPGKSVWTLVSAKEDPPRQP